MFPRPSVRSLLQHALYVLAGMLLAALLFAVTGSRPDVFSRDAQAAAPSAAPSTFLGEPNAPETPLWVSCTPVAVAVFAERMHVECAQSYGSIRFFAAPTSNPAHAARILSTLSTAQVAGRTLSILYDPDDHSGADYGCAVADCRAIHAVGFGQ